MDVGSGVLSGTWLAAAHILFWWIFWRALRGAAWYHLRDNESFHVLMGAIVFVLVLWTMQAGFAAGLSVHLIGATILTLMFGWAFAFLVVTLLVIISAALGSGGWETVPFNALLLGGVPVAVSHFIYRLADRKLPNHFFVYIFLCAFFGAAAAMAAVGLLSTAVFTLGEVYSWEYLQYNYLRYFLLLVFPEAFITGMVMTLLVVYYPRWVSTFDDARYLRNH